MRIPQLGMLEHHCIAGVRDRAGARQGASGLPKSFGHGSAALHVAVANPVQVRQVFDACEFAGYSGQGGGVEEDSGWESVEVELVDPDPGRADLAAALGCRRLAARVLRLLAGAGWRWWWG